PKTVRLRSRPLSPGPRLPAGLLRRTRPSSRVARLLSRTLRLNTRHVGAEPLLGRLSLRTGADRADGRWQCHREDAGVCSGSLRSKTGRGEMAARQQVLDKTDLFGTLPPELLGQLR